MDYKILPFLGKGGKVYFVVKQKVYSFLGINLWETVGSIIDHSTIEEAKEAIENYKKAYAETANYNKKSI